MGSRAVLGGPGRILLSKSWAGPGLLLGIFVGSWQALGLSWAAPGRVLGESWAAPGRLGRLLDSSWLVLGGFWALLGGSGAFLGAKLEPRYQNTMKCNDHAGIISEMQQNLVLGIVGLVCRIADSNTDLELKIKCTVAF